MGGTGDLPDSESPIYSLGQHLIIKDEVVGILQQRQGGKHLAGKGAVTGMVFGKLGSQQQILKSGQQAIE